MFNKCGIIIQSFAHLPHHQHLIRDFYCSVRTPLQPQYVDRIPLRHGRFCGHLPGWRDGSRPIHTRGARQSDSVVGHVPFTWSSRRSYRWRIPVRKSGVRWVFWVLVTAVSLYLCPDSLLKCTLSRICQAGVLVVSYFIFGPETYSLVILHRKTVRLRKELNDLHLKSGVNP